MGGHKAPTIFDEYQNEKENIRKSNKIKSLGLFAYKPN